MAAGAMLAILKRIAASKTGQAAISKGISGAMDRFKRKEGEDPAIQKLREFSQPKRKMRL